MGHKKWCAGRDFCDFVGWKQEKDIIIDLWPTNTEEREYKVMGIKDSALKISGSVLKKMVEKEQQKKPGCMGFLHQPKRPAALKKTK